MRLQPHLRVISVGEDAGSKVFVRQKRLAAERTGLRFSQVELPEDAELQQLRSQILESNMDPGVHGIIVQLPLPEALRKHEREVLDLVDPAKDVDCFHPRNFGQLALGEPTFLPATPAGILRLLRHYAIDTCGKRCVILGKSNIVGKPLGLLLAQESGPAATVVFCDRHTENVWELTRQADIIIVAAGKHHLLSDPKSLRSDGQAVVIDVGIHRVPDESGKTVVQGDVDATALRPHCRFLTPVPGGVGPMTVACLLEQVVHAASLREQEEERSRCRADSAKLAKSMLLGSNLEKAGSANCEELMAFLSKISPELPVAAVFSAVRESKGVDSAGHITLADFADWIWPPGCAFP
eukprot:TRINITY_DN96597_c0_g1_i1.p1 TRINITY_DN96597_c0_g1~~TRINITY_DN96597_c0_g1_i1.p1  ORF type:complete len:387 (-),score=85.36 TRINITY_DN96597_c0_g1_i1:87-1142(-)